VKVALVSSHPAFPASEGNRSRIQQLARAVMELGHDLTFVLLPVANQTADDAAHEAFFGKEGYVKISGGRASREPPVSRNWPGKWTLQQIGKGWRRAGERMSGNLPGRWTLRQIVKGKYCIKRLVGLESAYYSPLDFLHDPQLAEQLAVVGKDVEAVIVEYVFNSWAFASFPESSLRLLDTHDAFADRHHSYLARGVSDYWISLRPQDENAGFRRADMVIAIQQEEARRFRRQIAGDGGNNLPDVAVVSHLMGRADSPVESSVGDSAIFLASDNSANRHAVDSFIRNVLPKVVREIPGFDLKLAGSICAFVPDRPNVTKLGWVQDQKEAFAQAPLSVNPLLVGTGINIKLLEAMAAGVPTVSTATGVRGLPESYRNGVLAVRDNDHEAFAAAIVRFARDADLRQEVGRAAFEDAKRWNAEQVAALGKCLVGRRNPASRLGNPPANAVTETTHCA
jgi:polysaccharide biosynthesis protein PslH